MPPLPLTDVFANLPDPRRDTANKLHLLVDILAIATCADIGGAESWDAIAAYGRTKEPFFRSFLALEHGISSPDTFERLFAKLAPGAFAQAFGRWMVAACEATGLVPIAVDGKSARSAPRDTATGRLHVVTAWAAENRLVLGTVAVPDGSNEVAAIPELLRALALAGAIVTIDAAGCRVENARIIRAGGGTTCWPSRTTNPGCGRPSRGLSIRCARPTSTGCGAMGMIRWGVATVAGRSVR